jgi:tRNA pseudouridine13 synthase
MPEPVQAADARPLAHATGHLPGIGGRSKCAPEDFLVEECPAYAPAGQGEHLYLWIEKRGIPTATVVEALCGQLGVAPPAVGYAGKKDSEAVARQWLSVHTPADPDPARLGGPGWRVLAASRHRNKLRPGHLHGNRFTVVLRQARPGPDAERILQHLQAHGFPNYFGPQRLGPGLRNALEGRRLVRAARARTTAAPRGPLERVRFAVNAYQAALFNTLVATRLEARGELETLLPGDLAVLHRNGAAFRVEPDALAAAEARARAHELSASAPLFGTHTTLAEGEPGRWERDLLAREGLSADAFRLGTQRLSPKGERRAARAFAQDLAWHWAPGPEPALHLVFTLAPGVYATALLRELTRSDDLAPWPLADPGARGTPA